MRCHFIHFFGLLFSLHAATLLLQLCMMVETLSDSGFVQGRVSLRLLTDYLGSLPILLFFIKIVVLPIMPQILIFRCAIFGTCGAFFEAESSHELVFFGQGKSAFLSSVS